MNVRRVSSSAGVAESTSRPTRRTAVTCGKRTYGRDAGTRARCLPSPSVRPDWAKLADWGGSRQALIDFCVRGALATPLGVLLPLAELSLAVALLLPSPAWYGSLRALAVLLLFVTAIGLNLARGRRPDCRCFGQLQSAPVDRSTPVRDAALAAVGSFINWQGPNNPG
jgi:Methylamine utilisation protein MauE